MTTFDEILYSFRVGLSSGSAHERIPESPPDSLGVVVRGIEPVAHGGFFDFWPISGAKQPVPDDKIHSKILTALPVKFHVVVPRVKTGRVDDIA